MTMRSVNDPAQQTYGKMVWQGKWWILLIGVICFGLAFGLVALLETVRPKRMEPVSVISGAIPMARAGVGASENEAPLESAFGKVDV
jgi:hypothetical protein